MITVIADDLTGAAELGGIGLSKGLKVEISFTVNPSSQADLLVIATDTRSKSEAEAVAEMIEVTRNVAALKPELIFKKVDSVLRGYVVSELLAQLDVLQVESALLVPANPALGRTIQDGSYLINGIALNKTSFAADPEFPAKSADILTLLGVNGKNVRVKEYKTAPLETGITVAEVSCEADLKNWTSFYKEKLLLAGGSGFFKAVLDAAFPNTAIQVEKNIPINGTTLYVCGSAYEKSTNIIKNIATATGSVSYMPPALCQDPKNRLSLGEWCDEVVEMLALQQKTIIAVRPGSTKDLSPSQIRTVLSELVAQVFDKCNISELVIEGGSTASSVLAALGIKTLWPVNEFATGIIRSKVIEPKKLFITLKPGSYTWPNQVWQF